MTAARQEPMKVAMAGLGVGQQARLRERLDQAAELRCPEHNQPIAGVTIYGRENGWFDARWTTCCETLEQQAVAIVKERC